MGNIHVLDKQIAELIAAGEVVERPSSVIKELLENSIDAKSDLITVEIQRGGITYIRVSDNGCGIASEDVPLVFHRHATSKISQENDLEQIATLGFRGEAMASIAAVSRVEMMTRTHDCVEGTYYEIHGGEEQDYTEIGCPVGTTFIIRDLFYNTPARMKFLKKDNSEANSVAAIVEKEALSHPEISFKFIRDGQVKLHSPGDGNLLSAIHAVLGHDFAASMIPVDYKSDAIHASGYVCKPTSSRGNRTMQNFFINNRFVRSKTMMAALEEAYKHSVMVGKFPSCVLNLDIPYQEIDVNVHPAKIEVRFSNEKAVFDAVYYGVKSALKQYDYSLGLSESSSQTSIEGRKVPQIKENTPIKQAKPSKEYSYTNTPNPAIRTSLSNLHKSISGIKENASSPFALHDDGVPYQVTPKPARQSFVPNTQEWKEELPPCMEGKVDKREAHPSESEDLPEHDPLTEPQDNTASLLGDTDTEENSYTNARMIGELFGTYILLENKDELILIDKHAAHERLLFERLKKIDIAKDRQLLLSPILVHLSQEDYEAVSGNMSVYESIGFEVEDFGNADLYVRAIPVALPECDISSIVEETAHKLCLHHHDLTPEVLDGLLHNIACRSAIKAHDKNTSLELEEIIRMLRENEDVKYCPHGRPIARTLTRREIEKMFGRIQ